MNIFCKKTGLALAVSVALGGPSVVLAFSVDAPVPITYSTQQIPTSTTGTPVLSAGCSLDVTGQIGNQINDGIKRYLRFDLTEGAKFDDEPSMTISGVTSVLAAGGDNASYVIFLVDNDTGSAIVKETVFDLTVPGLKLYNSTNPVQLHYTVHSNDISAGAGTSGSAKQYFKENLSYVSYASGFDFRFVGKELKANVDAQFLEFATAAKDRGNLGQLTFMATPGLCNTSGSSLAITDLIGATASFELTGDFSALQDVDAAGQGTGGFNGTASSSLKKGTVYFDTAPECSTVPAGGNSLGVDLNTSSGERVTFKDINATLDSRYLCFLRPEKSQVVIANTDPFVLTLKPVGTTVSVRSVAAGKIVRDGVTLESPFFSIAPGYISRFMLAHLNPNAVSDAPFTITIQTDGGATFTPKTDGPYPYDATKKSFSGVLPKGTMLQVNASDLVTSFSGKSRGSASFSFSASNADVQGIYQVVNLASGESSSMVMPRPGGGTGVVK